MKMLQRLSISVGDFGLIVCVIGLVILVSTLISVTEWAHLASRWFDSTFRRSRDF